jgi:hypothetical protein
MQIEKIEELTLGSNFFESTGMSKLKVSRRVDRDNGRTGTDESYVLFPIRSISVSKALELAGNAPQPPSKREHIQGAWHNVPQHGDAAYLKKKAAFDLDVGFAIISLGLDVAFKDKEGKEIREHKERIECLKSQGFSQFHFEQLNKDIQELTSSVEAAQEEAEVNFSLVPSELSEPTSSESLEEK